MNILFANITESEILKKCINARYKTYKKNDIIIEAGHPTDEFGILLEGSAHSIKWDASGKLVIISLIEKGGAIGVLLAAKPNQVSPLTVQATSPTTVMMIPFQKLITRCEKNCPNHEKLIQNYISILAEKGLELHERINCLLEPTVREKILAYLNKIAHEQQSQTITLPINRNIMAEYLNVERSALSRELSRMKKDGIIDYHQNNFVLKQ